MNAIEIKNLNFSYPDGAHILKNVNLTIRKNEKVAIIGPNGSGKTTLLLCIGGILKSKCEVFKIFNEEIKENTDFRRKIGILLQNSYNQVLCQTVIDDIMELPKNLGFSEELIKEKFDEVVKFFDLENLKYKHPYDLSEGERRKVCLAGILISDPDILLLDDPISSLDVETRQKLVDFLKKIKKTIIFITYDPEVALKISDRLILLYSGKIVADGKPKDILFNFNLLKFYKLWI